MQTVPPSPLLEAKAGTDVVLHCSADGSGEPSYQWFRNGERLTRGPRLQPRRRLLLRAVRPSDAGAYSCAASNTAAGMVAASNGSLPLVVTGERLGWGGQRRASEDRVCCAPSVPMCALF